MEGLRGVAVLLVFWVHAHTWFSGMLVPGSLARAASRFLAISGHTGVDLFFVLSGYLVYRIAIEDTSGSIVKFWKRRLNRVYPVFLAVFLLYLLADAVSGGEKLHQDHMTPFWYVLVNAALLPGIFDIKPLVTVAWTLSYELAFYLAIPLLVRGLRLAQWSSRARVIIWLVLAAAYMGWRIASPGLHWPAVRFAPNSHVQLLMFVTGILVYEAGTLPRGRAAEWAGIGLWLGTFVAVDQIYKHEATLQVAVWRTLSLFAGYPLFFIHALSGRGILQPLLTFTPLRWLGNMSYSFYLVHSMAIHFVARMFPALGFPVAVPLSFLAAWLLSSAVFGLVEKPLSLRPAHAAPRGRP
jgi:peptidoglycan/LPS O-acetylase OafA/YrhL